MHICFSCVEIFAWGKYGGFGRATRTLGRELALRGVRVSAVVPRRLDQRPVEELDGITVYGFEPGAPRSAEALFRRCNADIYHSQEPSLGTALARWAAPDRRHIVTFRDPRVLHDWWMEFMLPSASRLQVAANFLYEDNLLVRRAVRAADARYCAAEHLIPKVVRKYGLREPPRLLPTPVEIPEEVEKSAQPTVVFNARLDRRKRPERFLALARAFPDIHFILIGKARSAGYEASLRREAARSPNVEWVGFVDQFSSNRLSEILSASWILVNTATREGLPNAFIEAAAHRCAILSGVDPDGFASRFGHHAADDDFERGLRILLQGETWRKKGEAGYRHVLGTFATDRALERHLDAYERLLEGKKSATAHRSPTQAAHGAEPMTSPGASP